MMLRPYQQAAVEAIYRYFMANSGCPLVVMPTGTGKSIVIGAFVKGALEHYPGTRILVLTHVRELIRQNYARLIRLWPEAPAGIYSAGLGRRDLDGRAVYAGIQSIHRKADAVGRVDLVLIDEAHLIPRNGDTMYGRFLAALKRRNPYVKTVGFTATPFRLDSGLLHEGGGALFSGIAYETGIAEMIEGGYLSEVVPKATDTTLDVAGVEKRGGEFIAGQLESAVDADGITRSAVTEIVAEGRDRKSWLCFCSGVRHARHVAEAIRSHGIECATVTGGTPMGERDQILAAFKAGRLRAVTNANVLTTGFDAPGVDLIAMLRPTASPGLHVQMIGRGTRTAPGKPNCLVLDFAGNTARHGPLDRLTIKPPGIGGGEAPVKVCRACRAIVHAGVRACPHCRSAFPEPDIDLSARAATDALLTRQIKPEWAAVTEVSYTRHEKPGKPPSLRVDYLCGLSVHKEWICFEHAGFPREKACRWWGARAPGRPIPDTVDEALGHAPALPLPSHVMVRKDGKYTNITQTRFGGRT